MAFLNKLALVVIACLVQWASCKVAKFDLNLSWEDHEVAGAVRKTILTNGQFPGPPLNLDYGDEVEILVNNSMPFGATIHFHGIEQLNTPWSDGVPGLSQAPIQPGKQFLYKWKALQYGSYIYHAHVRGQIDDGLYGPLRIQPREDQQRPFANITQDQDELQAIRTAEAQSQPMMLSDWRALTSEEIWRAEQASGVESYCATSVLLNGKGSVKCLPQDQLNALQTDAQRQMAGNNRTLTDFGCVPPNNVILGNFTRNPSILPEGFMSGCKPSQGPAEVIKVNQGMRWISWDLISMAGTSILEYSVDAHPMWVYAIDGRYIQPMRVHAVNVPIGSRYSVMVQLNQDPGDYTIRVVNNQPNQIISGTGILSYTDPVKTQNGPSQGWINDLGNTTNGGIALNESNVVPFPVQAPAQQVDKTFLLNVGQVNSSYQWDLGNASFPLSAENATPLLFNRSSIPAQYTITTQNGTWVDLIVNVTTPGQPAHPIHKHSTKFYVIGQGNQTFTWSNVEEARRAIPQNFNLQSPQLRDTFPTPSSASSPTWLALRYRVENPGPFLLHCHIQMHLSGGMALAIMDGVDAWPQVPEGYQLPAVEQ